VHHCLALHVVIELDLVRLPTGMASSSIVPGTLVVVFFRFILLVLPEIHYYILLLIVTVCYLVSLRDI
jgi:hypothetical protein